jgi:D-glucosaminate-6-phosphate ammonia-lyase
MRVRRVIPAETSISRRRLFQAGTVIAGAMSSEPGRAAPATETGSEVYTRLGVKPFINCTATLTINGGSLMLPEVVIAMEQAAHFHVKLDELMEKAGDRLAELLQVEWGLITSGTAAALTHATAGCLAGTDPEKIQRLPNLDGLKNEVIIPRESRNGYDHAIRTLGVRVVEVNSIEELRAAINPRTAMVELLGNHFGQAALDLKDIAPIVRASGIPILVDAAADYLIVPNPYIAQGADLVAYSGGKIIRGPQGAGLLVGRRDLVRAAWANSAPHHAFGRAMKVTKEEIVGMLRAVEAWRTDHDLQADFEKWKSWHAHIAGRINRVPGVHAEAQGPIRGGPFPTLKISWEPERIALTAGEVGRLLLNGEPRIMSQAAGETHSFLLRPVAMKAGEYEIVARRLYEIFAGAPKRGKERILQQPSRNITGAWEVDIDYEVGSAHHQLVLAINGNAITGAHTGWAYRGDIQGEIDGDRVRFRSTMPAEGNVLTYSFEGSVSTVGLSGRIQIGDYGSGAWRARRPSPAG